MFYHAANGGAFAIPSWPEVESEVRDAPNLLYLRVLLYQDLYGPRGNGPAVRVIRQKPNKLREIEARG